jgi:hypothetical protein
MARPLFASDLGPRPETSTTHSGRILNATTGLLAFSARTAKSFFRQCHRDAGCFSGDPILLARSAAYATSYDRRSKVE